MIAGFYLRLTFLLFCGLLSFTGELKSQQPVKFAYGYPATIQLPESFKYTTTDGDIKEYASLTSPVDKIYLTGYRYTDTAPADFALGSTQYQLETDERAYKLVYEYADLLTWDRRQVTTLDKKGIDVFWTEYMLMHKSDKKTFKSLHVSIQYENYLYGLTLDYPVGVYQDQISPILNTLLSSILISGTLAGERVKLELDNGVYKIPVLLNGSVKGMFIFDTGASLITLSRDMFNRLMESGTLSGSNYMGMSNVTDAAGRVSTVSLYMLNSVTIGNRTISDVECAVLSGENVPMLLGQNFLKNLGTFEVDYINHYLLFK